MIRAQESSRDDAFAGGSRGSCRSSGVAVVVETLGKCRLNYRLKMLAQYFRHDKGDPRI